MYWNTCSSYVNWKPKVLQQRTENGVTKILRKMKYLYIKTVRENKEEWVQKEAFVISPPIKLLAVLTTQITPRRKQILRSGYQPVKQAKHDSISATRQYHY
jgi:hypothetical protein